MQLFSILSRVLFLLGTPLNIGEVKCMKRLARGAQNSVRSPVGPILDLILGTGNERKPIR